MNTPFQKMKIRRFTRTLFFLIILLHITLLDFMFVNHTGLVFLPEESSRTTTLIVHFMIATLTLLTFVLAEAIRAGYKQGKLKVRESLLISASIVMALSIGYLLL